MKNEILYRGFESIPTRQGRGGQYQYVRWQDVADRMNEAFGIAWSSEVMSQEIVGNNIIVRVRVSAFDPTIKAFTSQEGFGGAPNDDRSEAGNPFKSAYSKALKDACKKWGLGLFLELEDEGGNSTPSPLPQGYHGREFGTPPVPQAPPMEQRVVDSLPPTPAASVENLAPEVRSMVTPTNSGLPTPPGVSMPGSMVSESVVISQQPVPPVSGLPEMPQVPLPTSPVAPPVQHAAAPSSGLPTPPSINLSGEMPMSKVGTINTGEPDRISDVQKAALHGILSFKGVNYEELAREAFEANGLNGMNVPAIDNLTYQEAVYVVKYGNDKFRRR